MGAKRTDEDVREQMRAVGNSLLHVTWKNGRCRIVQGSKYNRRITGETVIPFQKGYTIQNKTEAMGTLANCAGGQTPWNTFLTCEENYDQFYGDVEWKDGQRVFIKNNKYNWYEHFPQNPPEHYGWVVEVQPLTGKAVKLVSMGRFEHEAAKLVMGKSGKPVVYMSEDRKFGYIYKFISDSATSLYKGTLYVADTVKGRWIPLDLEKTPALKKHFKSQADVLTYANRAAGIAGGTQQDRPEDVEIDPVSGHIFITLTNNADRGNLFGSIVKITEKNGDYESLEFKFETWLAGSPEVGFACPDNLAFDKKGNLWMTTDMSAHDMGSGKFAKLGHNGLFFIPLRGAHAAKAFLVATAPVGAEFTGPMFSPDFKTLLLSVQHPGEGTEDPAKPTSCWPGKPGEQPKSAVVQITGPLLERLQST
jgi:secreted PhoX family phosphatase